MLNINKLKSKTLNIENIEALEFEELSDEELTQVKGGVTVQASVTDDSLTPIYGPFFGVMGSASAMVFSALGAAYGTVKS
ncbi:bacteriocin [Nostoc sp. ChiQUE01b]|uniref:bacteriocin n=1 Tax=Nostoc sp. ChiQUE01b TaxID=3075376 RepID=UPI002AD42034|nr:bacteriocin [Nostoc sp. ChiQUE01b]MDZ8260036.1 bacteriocin [Nostoc sp. ChiQUE01b]